MVLIAFLFFFFSKSHLIILFHGLVRGNKRKLKKKPCLLQRWDLAGAARVATAALLSLFSCSRGKFITNGPLISPRCVTSLLEPLSPFRYLGRVPGLSVASVRDGAYRSLRTGLFVTSSASGNVMGATGSLRFDIHYGELVCCAALIAFGKNN